jgi:hypothetical protein
VSRELVNATHRARLPESEKNDISRPCVYEKNLIWIGTCFCCYDILRYALQPCILHRKFKTNILINENARPPSLFLQQNRWTDRGNIEIAHRYMNVDCRNWERGRAVSFMRIFVLNFWYGVGVQMFEAVIQITEKHTYFTVFQK